MSGQLDILALEPFFGGARRAMLETVMRCSKHRWTLLKLPPRRIDRRLAVAAQWFAELMSRHWVGKVDVLFTSEAMNVAELLRLVPQLAVRPSVVYFHENQLPSPSSSMERATDLVNLSTAAAVSEIWFNSIHHQRSFIARATALVNKHPDLMARTPIPAISKKSRVYRPPVDVSLVHELSLNDPSLHRDRRTIFVDTRDADIRLLISALTTLTRRGQKYKLITVGPIAELPSDIPRVTISETDEELLARALLQSGIYLSVKPGALSDTRLIIAMAAGCRPVLPHAGFYTEVLPRDLHASCLYEISPDLLASRVQDVWFVEPPDHWDEAVARVIGQYDVVNACNDMDQRLEQIAKQPPLIH